MIHQGEGRKHLHGLFVSFGGVLELNFQLEQCGEAPEPACPAATEGQVIRLLGRAGGMCVQVSAACGGGGLRRKVDAAMIKAVTGPDYMSEPGGGVAARSRPEES